MLRLTERCFFSTGAAEEFVTKASWPLRWRAHKTFFRIEQYRSSNWPQLTRLDSKNHPFVDGNKRKEFLAGYIFLELSGLELSASEAVATVQMLALSSGEISEKEYAAWLKANCRNLASQRKKTKKTARQKMFEIMNEKDPS